MTTARTCSTPTGARCLVSGIRAVPALRTRALVQAPVPGRCFLLTVQRQSALSVSSTPVRHHVCQLYTGTYVTTSVSSTPVRHSLSQLYTGTSFRLSVLYLYVTTSCLLYTGTTLRRSALHWTSMRLTILQRYFLYRICMFIQLSVWQFLW